VLWRPPWWCRHRHLQTIWGPLFRRPRVAFRRERFTTRDGDFVDLDRIDGPAAAPILLLLHGLEGSSRSHYVGGMARLAQARGWRVVVLNFRGCSGEQNALPRLYHAGETGDLDDVVEALVRREPTARIVGAGVSLGGNVLLKWLGERGDAAPAPIVAAVGISVPFDLAACAGALDVGFERRVYTRNFLRTFRAKVRDKARRYPGFVDVEAACRARTFREYDRAVTAPLHGFADEVDYWTRASCRPWLTKIRRPALLINALDDPFVPSASLPDVAALPEGVRAEFVPRGGHVGFVDGWPWRVGSWAERRAVEFLATILLASGA
jgi:predicted alpha/beta-fold hydrolase